MDNTYINCFNNLISKFLILNNGVYDRYISEKIYDVLFDDGVTNKRLFFDYFSNIQNDSKDEIIKNILSIIVNKSDIVLKSINGNKIKELSNCIEKCDDKDILIKISNFIQNENYSELPDEMYCDFRNLNKFDLIALKSICLNCMKYSISSIEYNFNSIVNKKDEFLKNTLDYKNNVVELLNFYIPIYNDLYRLPCTGIFDINDDNRVYFIFDLVRANLNRCDRADDVKCNLVPATTYFYFLTYEYLLSAALGFFDENDKKFKDTFNLILNGGDFDYDIINYLFDCYKQFSPLSSLEDKIEYIKELRDYDNNNYKVYKTIACYDICRYETKQKKKKAFGL